MKKSILLASLLVAASTLTACTDADRAQYMALGNRFRVTLYASNGAIIKTWISSGKVSAEKNSDGWYFMREDTGKLERVSGTVDIEQLD
jgi:hypothetical protein